MAEITDYLRGLEEQEVQVEKEIVVVKNPVAEELYICFKEFAKYARKQQREGRFLVNGHSNAKKLIKGIKYCAKDISNFSILLTKYDDVVYKRKIHADNYPIGSMLGYFLSALTNQCSEKDHTILAKHLPIPINFLGVQNEKNIVVVGNVGCFVGWNMNGGEIRVKGNVGLNPGAFSKCGRIYFNNAESLDTACGMFNSCRCKATLYRRGRKIWPR